MTSPHSFNSELTKRLNRNDSAKFLSLVLLGAGLATGGSYLAWNPNSPLQSQSNAAIAQVPPAIVPQADPNFVTRVVDRVGPAVVRINATRTVQSQVPDIFRD
ncbi:MAG: serine protease, partial [Microcoleus sp. SIO2G3]|nr:serine protease [Microcoleus sp. SIO2G3]